MKIEILNRRKRLPNLRIGTGSQNSGNIVIVSGVLEDPPTVRGKRQVESSPWTFQHEFVESRSMLWVELDGKLICRSSYDRNVIWHLWLRNTVNCSQ